MNAPDVRLAIWAQTKPRGPGTRAYNQQSVP